MVNIIQGTNNKPISSKRLSDFFTQNKDYYNGLVYIGYPIIGTSEGPYPIDALWLSEEGGLVVINIVEGRELGDFRDSQDDSYNKLEAKLRSHKLLMNGRTLRVPIHVVTFAPLRNDTDELSDAQYAVCNEKDLINYLDSCSWQNPSHYAELVAVIQAISTIRKGRKKRDVKREDSRGAKLKNLEDSIANLDNIQGEAVIETVDGVQRIRGLAGSGKTIVLALKAAYLHAQHPDWKIAVTFNTRSLKGQFRQLINTFTIEQTNEEPDWDNLHIIQAWGAPGGGDKNGIYYTFCQTHGLICYDFRTASSSFGKNFAFEGACQQALNEQQESVGLYDAILVDEAQDFPPSFLRLCYELLKAPKRLVYAYDELQNLNTQSLPSPEIIFGGKFESSGSEGPQQDVILKKCYRNSRPVLVTAHALGFGIYRTPDVETGTGLVQMFDHSHLWEEVGYDIDAGSLDDGCEVTLKRTEESSPQFLESHSVIDDLIQFHCFDTPEDQAEWLVEAIESNLKNDELRPDDIVVINPDPLTTRDEVGPIRRLLFERGINSHLAGVDTSPDIFFDADSVSIAFTGIYRAKGNEAGMVYVINAQDCYSSFGNMARVRNRLFTAITRSKAWVRVIGIGAQMRSLMTEYEEVKDNNFRLSFQYPTADQRKHLTIVNRDMTEDEKLRVKKKKNDLAQLLEDLETGRVYPEDLGAEQLRRLRAFLNPKEN